MSQVLLEAVCAAITRAASLKEATSATKQRDTNAKGPVANKKSCFGSLFDKANIEICRVPQDWPHQIGCVATLPALGVLL